MRLSGDHKHRECPRKVPEPTSSLLLSSYCEYGDYDRHNSNANADRE